VRLLSRWLSHRLTRPVARGGEQFRLRHHSLFTPRDFDLSPFFRIVKPTLARGFDYKGVAWEE